jgi:uncharacterized protein (TIGR04255 family)
LGKKYTTPPIVEAVCEFRFEPSFPWDGTIPGMIYPLLKDPFVKRQQGNALSFQRRGDEGHIQTVSRVKFLREDERAFIQVGENLLAVNYLKPYPSWEEIFPIIERTFKAYREVAQPTSLQRIGLRYINKIHFPTDVLEPADYFEFYPYIGKKLPQDYINFGTFIHSPYEDDRDVLKLELVGSPGEEDEIYQMILDLDYGLVDAKRVALDDAMAWVETAHRNLEDAFEAAITDTLREKFNQG